jgi:DNA-binding MarR family transcriptional regulator
MAKSSGERLPPGEVLAGNIGFLLSKLGFLTAGGFAAKLAPLGINPGHFGLLRIVDQSEPRSQQALGQALGIPASRMVALVDELEEKDLLARVRDKTDRRVNTVQLTAKGRRLLGQAADAAAKWTDEFLAPLSAEEQDQLHALLTKLAATQTMPLGTHPAFVQRPVSYEGS